MSDVLRSYLNAKEKLNKSMPETQDRMDALGDYYNCSHAYAKWFHGEEEYILLWEMFVKRYNAERAILDCLVETCNLTEQDSNEGVTE